MRRQAMHSQQQNSQKATTMPIGGFVIDGQGREIPITEEMIQQACNALEKAQQQAGKRK
ncbi:PA1571 family protein [Pseudomonas sp. NPDC079086]